eukprot:TRINITY_DN19764_c0_g2_i1.p1 TRINITY_DN19764_c0_g2~~TRINITY_DN19764_c0_g2_i1.p1  ORF type:complete len:771 (+),score=232.36 TRINITY_DN19764_c0_g2_i1:131-2443(+)
MSSARSRRSKYPMIEVIEAYDKVMQCCQKAKTQEVPISTCAINPSNYIVAEDCVAKKPFPEFRASIFDGYAVLHNDVPGELSVIDNSICGRTDALPMLKTGQCVYVTTGAMIPNNATAVIMIEDTELIEGEQNRELRIRTDVSCRPKKGFGIRNIGSDIPVATTVIRKGDKLNPQRIGLLHMIGQETVTVFTGVTVGVLSTGAELSTVYPANVVGKINDSNRPMLLASCSEVQNTKVVDLGTVEDSEKVLHDTIVGALETCDVLISTGGVSMGDTDYIKTLLEKLGTVHFGRVCMKPGKPSTFATIIHEGQTKLFFGLPGNPVSAITAFTLFAKPALYRMGGLEEPHCAPPVVQSKALHDFHLDPGRPEYHRVRIEWCPDDCCFAAKSTGDQRSSNLLSLHEANGLMCLPSASGIINKGTPIKCIVIGDLECPDDVRHVSCDSTIHVAVCKDDHREMSLGCSCCSGTISPRTLAEPVGQPVRILEERRKSFHKKPHNVPRRSSFGAGMIRPRSGSTSTSPLSRALPTSMASIPSISMMSAPVRPKLQRAHSDSLLPDDPYTLSLPPPVHIDEIGNSSLFGSESTREESRSSVSSTSSRKEYVIHQNLKRSCLRVSTITLSDRASKGVYTDLSGPEIFASLRDFLPKHEIEQVNQSVIPDSSDELKSLIINSINSKNAPDVIVTTGGTGFSSRDITPETVNPLLDRKAEGVVTAMTMAGLKNTPHAMLSRLVAGSIKKTFIICLPGSPKAVRECICAVANVLPHLVKIMNS